MATTTTTIAAAILGWATASPQILLASFFTFSDLNCPEPIQTIVIIKINKDTFVDQIQTSQKEIKVDIDLQDPALLIYTSGTTGKPKGVMLSHNNLLAGGKNVSLSHNIKTNDRALCVLPLFHINGAIVTIIGPLVSQSSLVLCERFSVTNFWKFISKFKCTWFSVVPTIISALLNKTSENEINDLDLSSLRFGRSASAALAPVSYTHLTLPTNREV